MSMYEAGRVEQKKYDRKCRIQFVLHFDPKPETKSQDFSASICAKISGITL